MTTLPEFLMARLADDEDAYRGAMHMGCAEEDGDGPDVIHSATCPNRVLVEVDVKRRLIGLHRPAGSYFTGDDGGPVQYYCATCGSGEAYEYPADWPCDTLRLLALPYAGHPAYRAEWRPASHLEDA